MKEQLIKEKRTNLHDSKELLREIQEEYSAKEKEIT